MILDPTKDKNKGAIWTVFTPAHLELVIESLRSTAETQDPKGSTTRLADRLERTLNNFYQRARDGN